MLVFARSKSGLVSVFVDGSMYIAVTVTPVGVKMIGAAFARLAINSRMMIGMNFFIESPFPGLACALTP